MRKSKDFARSLLANNRQEKNWFRATQAFSILGFFAIAGSLAVGILHAVLENTRVLSILGIASCAASVGALLIEVAVFGGGVGNDIYDYSSFGYGFILSVIACIVSVGAAVCFAIELRRYNNEYISLS